MFDAITTAVLDWDAKGLPVSRLYGDVYFSNDGGLDEARHVFLHGNELPQRLAAASCFTVGETGFGSGLNFLALWQLWEQVAPTDAQLHFFSAEKHPLQLQDMERIHRVFPEIAPYAQALREQLPLPVPGYHRVVLAGGRVRLTLMYGDALEMLKQQDACADAWFLDGFAPRLNPDLWSAALAAELQRLSARGATIATFSTATTTQQVLSAAGFLPQKTPGFGRKKHMLRGQLQNGTWRPSAPATPRQITIAGAGLAGAATAYAFATRGISVTVYEQSAQPASGASANPSAICYPGVTIGWQAASCLYYAGFSYSRQLLGQIPSQYTPAHDFCGMLLFAKPKEAPQRQQKILETMQPDASVFSWVNRDEASSIAGISLPEGGLYFPASGWVNLRDMTFGLLQHPHIALRTHTSAPSDGQELLILCNGWQAGVEYPALQAAIHPVQGQTIHIPAVAPEHPLAALRCVLSYGGYTVPLGQDGLHVGASYEKGEFATFNPNASELAGNIHKLERFLEQPIALPQPLRGWGALRSVSRDRLPLVGALQEKRYANLAHGSRGLLSCALAGEYLASLICGEPLPLPRNIAARIAASRFI